MGEIADAMIGGELCEACGSSLDCGECADTGVPAYCSVECADNRDASRRQVCTHYEQNN